MVIKITGFPGDVMTFVPSQEQHVAFTGGKMHADKKQKPLHYIICNKLETHMEKIRLRLRHDEDLAHECNIHPPV